MSPEEVLYNTEQTVSSCDCRRNAAKIDVVAWGKEEEEERGEEAVSQSVSLKRRRAFDALK